MQTYQQEYTHLQFRTMEPTARLIWEEGSSLEELAAARIDQYVVARRFCRSMAKEDFFAVYAAKWARLSVSSDRLIMKRFAEELERDWADAMASYGDVPERGARCSSCHRVLEPVFNSALDRFTGDVHQCHCKKW